MNVGGYWDSVKLEMHIDIETGYAYEGGNVTCTKEGYTFQNAEIVESFAFQQDLNLRKSESGTVMPLELPGDWIISVDYRLTSVCP